MFAIVGVVDYQIVNMIVTVAKALARSKMEVADHFVDKNATFYTTAFTSLLVEMLAVVLLLALLNAVTAAKSPRCSSVSVAYFLASVTTAGLSGIRW